ncbi:MAG: hypothetical protein ACYSYL_20130, partial [Planctomycetota bacterium]|jgi:hypothetical protein
LPNLDDIIYAKDFTEKKYHGRDDAVTQQLPLYPKKQLLYKPKKAEDAWLQIPFEVKKKGPKRLLLVMTRSYDFGKYQAYLNGVKLGDVMDLYSKDIKSRQYHLLDFWPEPGTYTLRLECVGKNPISAGCYLGIESVRLRQRRPRVSKYGHDKDKDWRKKPLLYK